MQRAQTHSLGTGRGVLRSQRKSALAVQMGKQGAPEAGSESGPAEAPSRPLGKGFKAGSCSSPCADAPNSGLRRSCGAVRRDQRGPGQISPDLINKPFISVLKESAVFCLLN